MYMRQKRLIQGKRDLALRKGVCVELRAVEGLGFRA